MIKFSHTKSGYLCKKKYKFLLTKKKKKDPDPLLNKPTHPLTRKIKQIKKKKIELTKRKKRSEIKKEIQRSAKKWWKLKEKMAETHGSAKKWRKLVKQRELEVQQLVSTLHLTTFDNRKVLEIVFHFPYHWRPNQDINFKKIMGLNTRENHGIEPINMRFKFKLFFIFICNPIINIGSSLFYFSLH